MAKKVTAPRGMRDILPQEKSKREWALAVIREVYAAHGFDEIETPALENYDRLHSGLGGDNEKLSFSVLKRGLKEEELEKAARMGDAEALADLGLRFDLTVPLTRYYATNKAQLPDVFRAIQIGPVWRAERPQKGRYRQFVQADIDIIGESGIVAEAELILATSRALSNLGLHGCTIRINDRRVLTAMLNAAGFDVGVHAAALISIDKLDKIGFDGVAEELKKLDSGATIKLTAALGSAESALRAGGIGVTSNEMLAVLPEDISVTDRAGETVVESLEALGQALSGVLPEGVTLSFDPTLVRGMGYYTGTIFEISHPESGSSVGGGGRYDGMVGRFLGQSVPAVGFSIGFERIIDLVTMPDAREQSLAIIFDNGVDLQNLIRIKTEMIAAGYMARTLPRQKNLKAQLDRLSEAKINSFVLVSRDTEGAADLEVRALD